MLTDQSIMYVVPQHRLVLLELAACRLYVAVRYAQALFEDETGDEDLISNRLGGRVEEERQRMHNRDGLEVCSTLLGLNIGVIAESSVQLMYRRGARPSIVNKRDVIIAR
jgi:hypothetical protein